MGPNPFRPEKKVRRSACGTPYLLVEMCVIIRGSRGGIFIPEKPLREILDNTTWNPLVAILNEIFKDVTDVDSFEGLFRWASLVPPPSADSPSQFLVALPDSFKNGDLYGFSRFKKNGVDVFTMSCAACHSDQLFGQTILGMSKRFPRANDFFIRAQRAAPLYSS